MSPEKPASETAILITVALATMLAPLNSTMIGVALPEIMREFAIDLSAGSWLVIAYLITMASLQPVGGKLGDRLGRRPLIIAGLIYFGLASVGAAFSSSLTEFADFPCSAGNRRGHRPAQWHGPHARDCAGLAPGQPHRPCWGQPSCWRPLPVPLSAAS